MDRIQAKEKINKLLRLANDKGATESERLKLLWKWPISWLPSFRSRFSVALLLSILRKLLPVRLLRSSITNLILIASIRSSLASCLDTSALWNGIRSERKEYASSLTSRSMLTNSRSSTRSSFRFITRRKKLYDIPEADFYWYFAASFSSGYTHFQKDTASFRSAYELGKEFFDKKNTIGY